MLSPLLTVDTGPKKMAFLPIPWLMYAFISEWLSISMDFGGFLLHSISKNDLFEVEATVTK